MKRKILTALVVFFVIIISIGVYIFSVLPKPQGKPVVLQEWLFKKPENAFPVSGKFFYKSSAELRRMLLNREATSVEIITDFINYIKNNNWKYCALVYLRENEALAEAKIVDAKIASGDTLLPLLGIPVTIKEHIWVKGSPSTWNSKMFGFTAYKDAPLVEAIKNAGAIILGTTNVPFMLSDYQTQGEVYPTASNPYDTTRTPGGSTGGGAAALAAGFTTIELGSDLGGSVRVPSAFCGLYGLKPTFGVVNLMCVTADTVSKSDHFALATLGPLARTPEDLELFWNAMLSAPVAEKNQHKVNWKFESNKTLSDYRFAWIDEWKREIVGAEIKIGKEIKQKLAALADSLKLLGATVEQNAPPIYDAMLSSFNGQAGFMMGGNQHWIVRKLIKMQMKNWGDGTMPFEAFGQTLDNPSEERWEKVMHTRDEVNKKLDDFFTQYDFFILPLSFGEAFRKCAPGSKILSEGIEIHYANYVPYAALFNSTGNPCLIVPVGLSKNGMPLAIQIVGPHYSEYELLHLAKLLKSVTGGFIKPQ